MASTLLTRPTHIAMPPSPFSNLSISYTPSPSSRLENPFESPLLSPALVFYTAPSTPIAESPASQAPPQLQNQAPNSPPLTPVMHIAIPHVLPPSSPSSFSLHTPPNPYPPVSYPTSNSMAPPPEHITLHPTSSPTTDDSFPGNSESPDDNSLDDEGLSTLERIYLYSRSKSSFHRVFIASALPELLEQVTPHEAIAYVLPLLNTLATDDDEMVKEAFSSKLVTIIWWFFTHCQLIPSDGVDEDSLNPPEFQNHEGPPTISVQAFTPILGTLLLSPNVLVGGATRYAVVALLGRIKRINAMESQPGLNLPTVRVQGPSSPRNNKSLPETDDDEDIVIGLFGQDERTLFEKEILFQVVVGMGRLDSGEEEQDFVEEGHQQPPASPSDFEGYSSRESRREQEPQVEIVLGEEDSPLRHPKQDYQILSSQPELPDPEFSASRPDVKKLSQTDNPYFPPLPLSSHEISFGTTSNDSPMSTSSSGSSNSSTGSMTATGASSQDDSLSLISPSFSATQPSPSSSISATLNSTLSALSTSSSPFSTPDPKHSPSARPPSPPMLSSHQSDPHAFSNVSEVSDGNWPSSPSRSRQQDASAYGALSSNMTPERSSSSGSLDVLSYESGEFDEEGECDEVAVGRLSSMSLMAAVAASGYLDDDYANTFVTEVERVSHDPLYWVRREACFALGALAKAVPAEVVQLTLMRTLQDLISDPIHHVRHSSLFALPTILSRLPFSERRQKALDIMVPMSMDESADVRAGVLEALGEVIYTFHDEAKAKATHNFAIHELKESETPPEELLKMFLGRTQDRRAIDEQQPRVTGEGQAGQRSLIANKQGALEAFYQDPSRPLICAFNFPAVALTVGRSRWSSVLRDTYLWLAASDSTGVRRTLAASLGEMAKILGEEHAQRDLLAVWHKAFRTPEDDVRSKVIECLAPFVSALPQRGQLEVLNSILDVWSSGGLTSWREREGIVKSLNDLLNIEGREIAEIVGRLMMHALADSVNTVREAAIFMLPNVWMTFKGKNLLDGIRSDFMAMARSEMSRRRMTYIACQQSLLLPGPEGGDPPMEIDDELCSTLVSLASDSIVGVRIGVARLIGFICGQQRKLAKLIPPLLLAVIPVLSQDSSNEVRSYVLDCLEEHPKGGSHQELNRTTKSAISALTFSRPPVPVFRGSLP
ncbi:hypothetical protein GYMLUDRAFT_44246 [Collybiopsis luxurians FD-317 M1]|uniref:ARM repeat-containing protein n=1 Tax=Collybiopsis luxurians FD-317 M1 TaxID=944289 RepID=A0A0D0CBB8_9AGAR|nr:hypothetical protein GYMLUDRAFT_44246 [Collybiopsis luxurians FD-317 M1]